MDENKILEQVSSEYQAGYNAVEYRRQQVRERFRLYNDQRKDPTKISVNTMYFVIDTMLSMYYDDKMKVSFQPRSFYDHDVAHNLKVLAEFDYDEMDLDTMAYKVQWDRLFHGVGIRIKKGFDKNRKVPVFQEMDPISWIPDPYMYISPNSARWHGFEVIMTKQEMIDAGYKNIDSIPSGLSSEQRLNEEYFGNVQGIEDSNTESDSIYTIYHHYTIINGRKHLVTTDYSHGILLNMFEIEPVTKEEKENPSLVPFPIVLNYFSPVRNNPFGVSIPDLLEDKQRAKSILANLRLYKEKEFALGEDILFDPKVIKNKSDLANPSLSRKFIPADLNRGNAMAQVPKSPMSGSTFSMENSLDKLIEEGTGISDQRAGLMGDRSLTATENQQLQANSNLKLALKTKINNWGERDFWALWFRCYKEYFRNADKKVVRVTHSFGVKTIEFKKRDFITSADPEIDIQSESSILAERQKELTKFMAVSDTIFQSRNSPRIAKDFARRKLLRLSDVPEDEIYVFVPESPEEIDAKEKLELINNGDIQGAMIESVNSDHYTYLVYFDRAIDNEIKRKAILARRQMLQLSGQGKGSFTEEEGINSSNVNALQDNPQVDIQPAGPGSS